MPTAKRDTVGARTTRMGQGFEEARKRGGGIVPGAHPEFDQPTPLDKTIAAGKNIIKAIQEKFKPKSPSHIKGD